ncbi:AVAST type 3 anti-phage nuclease/ATPase Avs3a [Pseudomonas sp. B21-053]|uniref:AVAST type 3 anti-phage nuclease/ATPase Avs3a n=1 Tax=Pseudomonas sp. B21-053 TaxID=2895493 RepID=UPI00223298AB|nr:AVAST type 3 anti-phage nuclease/ATPase Avs3a [Pseudomonas sp. B21-053]UZE14563.1 NACHT domain-containing protein [Pseudomonas sp. B21-053]
MSESMLVRASRDGDQFHYLWAARRALQLLAPQSGLVAITIEGAATTEFPGGEQVEVGEQLIDIAEYYGSTELESATRIRYLQLKHSTLQVDEVWQPSGLEKTICGFAERYAALQQKLPGVPLNERLEFWFVTNRTINADFIAAVEDAAAQKKPRYPGNLKKLKAFTSLDGEALASFCGMLRLDGSQDNYWTQRNILFQDVSGYLPDMDVDAPIRLKDLVNRKALSESATNPAITKMDVLRVLNTDEAQLFPAPCLIEELAEAIPRQQEQAVIRSIIDAADTPVIVHADAGVGKSILSTRICQSLPNGSVGLLYDCFGNGQYRSVSGYRHRHRTALVQLANQLSALGFCHPLIPTVHADSTAYMRAFMHRVGQAVAMLRAKNKDALLCIIIDAADNAQMAAEEVGEPRSFIRDLLRETLPEGVRLVALCRPYREIMLDPPPHALLLALNAFTVEETSAHLRKTFADASEYDVAEFHRLSSHNPRVQALALSRQKTLPETLRLLGPNPTTVDSVIDTLLEKSIATLRDAAAPPERSQIDLICAGLAALRPLIPIAVLAEMSGVNPDLVRSFALDLGRPLVVNEGTIQFFDEPAESWFRKRFKPASSKLGSFIAQLSDLSSSNAYVAGVLPQLMLEAGQFSELVDLALTSSGLPDSGPVERRDIELQRLQFALKASLRIRRYPEAAKLALKAGGESAGDERQRALLQENADMVSAFMDSNGVQEIVSRRTFGSGWIGSHHVYEATILSGHADLIGEARSRLRMAEEWLGNWAKLSAEERQKEPVTNKDRAMMAVAHLSIHGAESAAKSLRRWTPRSISYEAGRIVAKCLLDHGRYQKLDELAAKAGSDLSLVLALAEEARNLHHWLPAEPVKRIFKLLTRQQIQVDHGDSNRAPPLSAVLAVIETAYHHSICDTAEARDLLARYLPAQAPAHLSSRFDGSPTPYLRACALHAVLSHNSLELIDVASPTLKTEMQATKSHSKSQELREFEAQIGALIPWVNLWAQSFVNPLAKTQLIDAVAQAKSTSTPSWAHGYRDNPQTANEIANLRIDILLISSLADHGTIKELVDWTTTLKRPLFTPTLNRLTRLCATVIGAEIFAFEMAEKAATLHRAERSDVRHLVEGLVDVARSLLPVSPTDAEGYFNEAVEVASKIGEENFARWEALIQLAERAANETSPAPVVAYNFSRCAEVTRSYVDRDKHFAWNATIEALVGLCPSSSLTIASRWRDRHFGSDGRILEVAIRKLLSIKKISPLDALPLIGFRAEWNETALVEAALEACTEQKYKDIALKLAYRYMTLEPQTAANWQALESIASSESVTLLGLSQRTRDTAQHEATNRKSQPSETYHQSHISQNKHDWEEVFSGCDLSTSTGILTAHKRFRDGEPPFYMDVFFSKIFERIQVGKESSFLTAFANTAKFSLWDIRNFLETLPPQWKARPALRKALEAMLRVVFGRHCMEITRNRYNDVTPLDLAYQSTGIEKHELLDVVLDAIAESAELAGAERLFSLVGLLADKLTDDEALGTLSYGLELFDAVLEESDGDGPWSQTLSPPTTAEDALAGYIWAGLASPVTATRWEAAHTVVALCALNRKQITEALFTHAINDTKIPYADARFEFYSLHAHQWLLIAASRAALEYPATLVPHLGYFLVKADPDQHHVLIRLFAARTLMALIEQGLINLPPETKQRLADACACSYERVEESAPSTPDTASEDEESFEEKRDFFGGDFDQYWLAPLGRCFGMKQSQVCNETRKTLRNELGNTSALHWAADARNKAELFRYEDTNCRHSTYPRVDNLSFYHSYHSMMMTAGRLLSTHPQVEVRDDWYEEKFSEWLTRHDIARSDGRWVADRRDPEPGSRTDWPEHGQADEWLKSMSIRDFDRALYPSSGLITIWGHWTEVDVNHSETISVHSALVSPTTSSSLLRAIQTVEHPHDFRIPSADDDLEFDTPPYLLKGWVQDQHQESGIDNSDPWAGNVRFPVPEPAAFIVDLMNMSTDADRREWVLPSSPMPVMRSHTWGYFQENDRSEQATGVRLDATISFVIEFLKATGKDLVVEVEIQRNARHQNYRNRGEDELQYITPSNRIFILKGDGTFRTL